MPDAIPTLEERLRGRFKWGLITDIQPPDLETRLAILRNKAERDHSPVPRHAGVHRLRITTNIRELEGALIRVTAYASLNHVPISMHMAEGLLGDLLTDSYVKPRTDEELLNEIADHPRLQRRIAARQEPSAAAGHRPPDRDVRVPRAHRPVSYPAIARLFGGRDHTTVIHAVDKIQRLMKERKQIYDQVTDLVQRLKKA
jgi:chromosomal replication initiator protein